MENFATLVIPAFFLFFLLRLIVLPLKWGTKIFLNSACGFLCLWLLNSVSGFTGLVLPINAVTVLLLPICAAKSSLTYVNKSIASAGKG